MALHWWKILCYTKSCDCATLKAEMMQYLGSGLPNGATRKTEMVQYLGSRLRRGGLHEKQRWCSISAVGCAGS